MQRVEVDAEIPVLPDHRGPCISNIVPALLADARVGGGWIPDRVLRSRQVVVLLIDGLGWNQLAQRAELAPTLAGSEGGPITTIAPSTTAAALTSFATGTSVGDHGIVGYKIRIAGETLNTLRWTTERGDARQNLPPSDLQVVEPFLASQPVVITRSEFETSGFTQAHLCRTDFRGWGAVSTLVHRVAEAVDEGAPFVYAYYDGLDRIGHECGHGAEFDAEYAFVDRLVADVRAAIGNDVALVVTADHGQVHTGDDLVALDHTVMRHTSALSGEERFVWLHAVPGHATKLHAAAVDAHGHHAWVRTREELIDQACFGSVVSAAALARLGDVAIIARDERAFVAPDAPAARLIGRHGSLTAAEMYVPLLCPE